MRWLLCGCVGILLGACGLSDGHVQEVWTGLWETSILALPALGDFYRDRPWEPNIQCAHGVAQVRTHDVAWRQETDPQHAFQPITFASQSSQHDIALHGCGSASLHFKGMIHRELQLSRLGADQRPSTRDATIDELRGTLIVTGAVEDTCNIDLRGVQRGRRMIYHGTLCETLVERQVLLP